MNVCVVGNGPSALNHRTGKFIDSCDIVIRVGNCVTDGHTEFIGSKTTIYAGRWKKLENNLDLCAHSDQVWILYPEPPHDWSSTHMGDSSIIRNDLSIKRMGITRDKVAYVPMSLHRKYRKIYNRGVLPKESDMKCGFNIPSTGTVAIDMALHMFPEHSMHITGFDGYAETTYYFDLNRKVGKDSLMLHDALTQQVELTKTIVYNNINVI